MNAIPEFTGPESIGPEFTGTAALTLRVSGEGVAIDPAAGRITLSAGGLVITGQGAGAQAGGFRLSVVAEAPEQEPRLLRAPALLGGGRIGEEITLDPGDWTVATSALGIGWQRDGANVPAAAGRLGYRPGAGDDRTAIRAVVTAANAAGAVVAATEPLGVTYAAPVATGALDDLTLTRGAAPAAVATAAAFSGAALRFSVSGAGAGIDPATGVLRLPTDVARTAAPVTVTASNSGGAAAVGFRVTVKGVAPALSGVALADQSYAQNSGTRTVDASVGFVGTGLSYALAAAVAGVSINAATGVVSISTAAARAAATLTVRASNTAGSAERSFAIVVTAAFPTWNSAHWPFVELTAAPLGRLQFTISAAAVLDPLFDYYLTTSDTTVVDQALVDLSLRVGEKVAPGAIMIRAPKVAGTVVYPTIIALRKADGAFEPIATKEGFRIAAIAPAALSGVALADQSYARNSGTRIVDASVGFVGTGLSYALAAAVAGVSIDAATGAVSISTATVRAATTLTVRAGNTAGSAERSFAIVVTAGTKAWPILDYVGTASGEARSYAQTNWNASNVNGQGNSSYCGSPLAACAYASFAGNTETDAYVVTGIKGGRDNYGGPSLRGGYSAQHDTGYLCAVVWAKLTPRVWAQFDNAWRASLDQFMRWALVAAIGAAREDGVPFRGDMLGNATNASTRGGNPNISSAPSANIAACCAYLGVSTAKAYLDTVVVATEEVAMRSSPWTSIAKSFSLPRVANAPTHAQIQTNCRRGSRFGVPITDQLGMWEAEVVHAFSKTITEGYANGNGIPASLYAAYPTGSWAAGRGRVVPANLAAIRADPEFVAIKGTVGAIREMDSTDAGGLRLSASYSEWTHRMMCLYTLIVFTSGMVDPKSARAVAVRDRIKAGCAHMRLVAQYGWLSAAHIVQGGLPASPEDNGQWKGGGDVGGWDFTRQVTTFGLKWHHEYGRIIEGVYDMP